MKLSLHHIETAVRKQFIWTFDPKTRWATNPAFNLGSKGLGATVFIGLAIQFGFDLQDVKDYLDLEELDVDAKLKAFNTRMNEMLHRRLVGENLDKKDMTYVMYLKKRLVVSYLRLHYMKEHISTAKLNH